MAATGSDALALGRKHHQAGRIGEAKALYEGVLADDPENPDALHLLGVLNHQVGHHDVALSLVGKALVAKPDFAFAHNTRGAVLQVLGRLDEAEAAFRAAAEVDPDLADAHFNLGTVALARHRLDEAARAFGKSVELEPNNPEARLNLGVAYMGLGHHTQAIAVFEDAIALKEDFAAAHSSIGTARNAIGDFEAAAAAYRRAIEAEPDNPDTHYNLGNVLKSLDDAEGAMAAYRRAIELRPDFPKAHANLGNSLWNLDRPDEAEACYRRAIELEPGRADLHCLYGSKLLQRGDAEAALKIIDEGLAARPGHTKGLAYRSHALWELGRRDEARVILDLERFVIPFSFDSAPGFENIDTFNAALAEHIQSHPTLFGDPTHNATRNGEHTGELLQEPKGPIGALEQMIMQSAETYRDRLGVDPGHPFLADPPEQFELTVWAVVMKAQGHQVDHIHPTSWLSGCYYAKVPNVAETDAANRSGWIEFGRPDPVLGCRAEPEIKSFQPKEGTMVLFPSYLYHRTIPYAADETRISIAFDVMRG